METAAATCYACRLFRRGTQLLELTTKRIEEQSLHDVLFELSKTVLRCSGSLTRDHFSGWVTPPSPAWLSLIVHTGSPLCLPGPAHTGTRLSLLSQGTVSP